MSVATAKTALLSSWLNPAHKRGQHRHRCQAVSEAAAKMQLPCQLLICPHAESDHVETDTKLTIKCDATGAHSRFNCQ